MSELDAPAELMRIRKMAFGSSLIASPLLLLLHVLLFVSIGAAAAESTECDANVEARKLLSVAQRNKVDEQLSEAGEKGDTAKALKLIEQGSDMEWQNPNYINMTERRGAVPPVQGSQGLSTDHTTILGFLFIYETPKRKDAPGHLKIGVNEKWVIKRRNGP